MVQNLLKKVEKAEKYGWVAGDTSVSDLPKSDLSLMCGLQPVEKPRFGSKCSKFLKRPTFFLKKKFLIAGIGKRVMLLHLSNRKVSAELALPFQYAELWKAKN
jgi:hypothetical protein